MFPDFPASPTVGDVFTSVNGLTYQFNSNSVWEIVTGGSGGSGVPGVNSVGSAQIQPGAVGVSELSPAVQAMFGISQDANNALTLGSDDLPYAAPASAQPVGVAGSVLAANAPGSAQAAAYFVQPCNCSGGPVYIAPPASPVAGMWFSVSDAAYSITPGTNMIILDFTSQLIFGQSDTYNVNVTGATQRFTYVNATVGWVAG